MTGPDTAITRRSALGLFGLAAAGPWLGGCGRDEPSTPRPTGSGSGGDGVSGSVRLALAAANTDYEGFMRDQMQRFKSVHPDVAVELRFFPPAEYANAINLSFTSDEAPDVYRLTGPSPATNMVNSYRNDWLQPLTPFLTDEFQARSFAEGTWDNKAISGLYIGDDVYGLPFESMPYTQVRILYCNRDLLAQAGAKTPPTTWDEMVDLATKITRAGKDAHGFGISGQQTVVTVDALQSTAAAPMGGIAPIDYTNGMPGASDASYVDVVEMLRTMNADGLITPGWESWNAQRPIQEFALGALGMYVGANFHAARIRDTNPDLAFDMGTVPVPAAGRGGYSRVPGLNQPYWGMSKSAQAPEAAWALLDFMSTAGFQEAAYRALKLIPALTEAVPSDQLEEDTKRLLEIMAESERVAPSVLQNGPDADQLLSAATAGAPNPNAVDLYTKAITEDGDYAQPARDFDSSFDTIIDTTVKKLKGDGLEVSRDDLAFPDWNPLENYAG